jgi:D-alanine transaminase
MPTAYLNGSYVEQNEAVLPIMDRGLLFGDSIYEVIPVYGGSPFCAVEHLQRLNHSLQAIRLKNPLSEAAWLAVIERLSQDNPGADQSIYLQVTRGNYPKRAHRIPAEVTPNVFAFASPLAERDPRIAEEGIQAITVPDIRWHRCDIKTTNLLANVLAQAEAAEQGADDAILLRNGEAKEGTASNLFIVLDDLLITPPDSDQLLPGVTRNFVLELASEADIAYTQASISEDDLRHASEIWLTSSTREIAPVVMLDGKAVGIGKPGPHWQFMDQLYQTSKKRLHFKQKTYD